MEGGLAPCPFCGGQPRQTAHLEYRWFAPVCQSCGVRGPAVRIPDGTAAHDMKRLLQKADDLWNTRVEKLAQQQKDGGA